MAAERAPISAVKACVTLLTREPERLLAFYREVLGLDLRFAAARFAEVATRDGFRVAIMTCDDPPLPAGATALGFAAADWSGARAELAARGLLDREEEDRDSGVRLLWFRDPEGRPLYLWQMIDGRDDS